MAVFYYGSKPPVKPYIGITGIENATQLDRILSPYDKNVGNLPHQLMIVALVSYKSLARLAEDNRVLVPAQVEGIFDRLTGMKSHNVFLALHYFTKPIEKVDDAYIGKVRDIVEAPLSRQVALLTNDLYDKYVRVQMPFDFGIQSNVIFPDVNDFNLIKEFNPRLKVIFQISDFSRLEEAKNYKSDYFLIDASRGKGVEMDVDKSVELYKSLNTTGRNIAFAGGISPDNVRERVGQLSNILGTTDLLLDA